MSRFASRLIIWLLIAILILFTATRVLDFLSLCFPPSQQWMAWPSLCCFDIGCLAWLFFAGHGAEGIPQRTLAYGMVLLDLGGVVIATMADMLLYAEMHGAITAASLPAGFQTIAMVIAIAVIVLNFAGLVLVHLTDPGHQRRAAVQHARDYVHAVTIEAIKEQSRSIAPLVARDAAEHWARDLLAEARLPQLPSAASSDSVSSMPVIEEEPAPQSGQSQNGHIPPQAKKK